MPSSAGAFERDRHTERDRRENGNDNRGQNASRTPTPSSRASSGHDESAAPHPRIAEFEREERRLRMAAAQQQRHAQQLQQQQQDARPHRHRAPQRRDGSSSPDTKCAASRRIEASDLLAFVERLLAASAAFAADHAWREARLCATRAELLSRHGPAARRRHTDEDWLVLAANNISSSSALPGRADASSPSPSASLRRVDAARAALHAHALQRLAFLHRQQGHYADARLALLEAVAEAGELRPQTLLNLASIEACIPGRDAVVVELCAEASAVLVVDLAALGSAASQARCSAAQREAYVAERVGVAAMLLAARSHVLDVMARRCMGLLPLVGGGAGGGGASCLHPATRLLASQQCVVAFADVLRFAHSEVGVADAASVALLARRDAFSAWLARRYGGAQERAMGEPDSLWRFQLRRAQAFFGAAHPLATGTTPARTVGHNGGGDDGRDDGHGVREGSEAPGAKVGQQRGAVCSLAGLHAAYPFQLGLALLLCAAAPPAPGCRRSPRSATPPPHHEAHPPPERWQADADAGHAKGARPIAAVEEGNCVGPSKAWSPRSERRDPPQQRRPPPPPPPLNDDDDSEGALQRSAFRSLAAYTPPLLEQPLLCAVHAPVLGAWGGALPSPAPQPRWGAPPMPLPQAHHHDHNSSNADVAESAHRSPVRTVRRPPAAAMARHQPHRVSVECDAEMFGPPAGAAALAARVGGARRRSGSSASTDAASFDVEPSSRSGGGCVVMSPLPSAVRRWPPSERGSRSGRSSGGPFPPSPLGATARGGGGGGSRAASPPQRPQPVQSSCDPSDEAGARGASALPAQVVPLPAPVSGVRWLGGGGVNWLLSAHGRAGLPDRGDAGVCRGVAALDPAFPASAPAPPAASTGASAIRAFAPPAVIAAAAFAAPPPRLSGGNTAAAAAAVAASPPPRGSPPSTPASPFGASGRPVNRTQGTPERTQQQGAAEGRHIRALSDSPPPRRPPARSPPSEPLHVAALRSSSKDDSNTTRHPLQVAPGAAGWGGIVQGAGQRGSAAVGGSAVVAAGGGPPSPSRDGSGAPRPRQTAGAPKSTELGARRRGGSGDGAAIGLPAPLPSLRGHAPRQPDLQR